MGRFKQGKIIGLAVAVCLIVICGVLLWRAKPQKTEETLVISHALKEDKGSNTTHKKQAEKNRQTPTAMPTATPTATPQGGYAEITSHDKMKIYEDTATVVIGDTGYELYNYVPSIAIFCITCALSSSHCIYPLSKHMLSDTVYRPFCL